METNTAMFTDFLETIAIEDRPHFIGELADRFQVSHRTLRFWEEKGLIAPKRDHTRNRYYTAAEVARIAFVVDCRRVGLSVDEIRDLVMDRDALPAAAFRDRLRLALEKRRFDIESEVAERRGQTEVAGRWIATLLAA
jgi:DNA-binding transcriptional MerR regulator